MFANGFVFASLIFPHQRNQAIDFPDSVFLSHHWYVAKCTEQKHIDNGIVYRRDRQQ